VEWRNKDYCASKMVKALKGDPIKGYFEHSIGGKLRRFDQSNVSEFVDRVPRALARMIQRHYAEPATIVPIPNSHVTSSGTVNFKTLALARKVADASGGQLKVSPAIVFRERQIKSREGGSRDPDHFEKVYKVVRDPKGPIILLDDVCTSGAHMIGAHRRLDCRESPVVLACAFGRTTKQQLKNPISVREEEIDLD
jgi:hypothetical protein